MTGNGREDMAAFSNRTFVLGAGAGVVLLAGLGAGLGGVRPWTTRVVAPAPELKWHQLVPPAPRKPPKSFIANRSPAPNVDLSAPHNGVPGAQPQAEGRWMSAPPAAGETPAPVVAALDGKRVRIGGYVVSLDFDATKVKEFLLVPFVGACIHVPPPPANQIVYVKSADGFEVTGMFDPVWVTGTLKATTSYTGLAEAGYSLTAEKVERRPKG